MILSRIFSYPWSWGVAIGNTLAAVAVGYWFQSDAGLFSYLLGVAVFLFGFVSWGVLLKYDNGFRAYLSARKTQYQTDDLDILRRDLMRLGSEQGQAQLTQLNTKLTAFIDVLKLRFQADEFTYHRYQQTAETVYQGGIQNLKNLRAALESVKSIDIETLEVRLAQMSETDAERLTLLKRHALHTEQLAKAEQLLVENEEAMTSLTNVSTALANAHTEAPLENRNAIDALEALASRASRYSAATH